MLRDNWQTEGARVSARDALAHEFFGANVVVPVAPICDKEQRRRFAGVRKRLQQLHASVIQARAGAAFGFNLRYCGQRMVAVLADES